ncbi:MAG TPA: superoxide dismutase [Bryobacteraceae bacterium]|nr:superoxide dismutase [Bryobacteraceae bacterium]
MAGGSLAPSTSAQTASAVTLPKLPYATDALEPYIDARTMEIHHGKHHQAYVDNLNKALGTEPSLSGKPVERLVANLASVPESARMAIRNNGGGHLNHSLFWQVLSKSKSLPKGKLKAAIDRSFGSQTAFEDKLKTSGLTVFGSGWVWALPQGNGRIAIETSPNQDSPWMQGKTPLLGLDVWEHAYYLKYQNRRADYLTALVQVVNWDLLSGRYEEGTK